MKKIVAQQYFYKSAINGTSTVQDYYTLYTVPEVPTENQDEYATFNHGTYDIWVFPNISNGEEALEMNYNIRIVKEGDKVDPRSTNAGGEASNVDESQWMKHQGVIVNSPSQKKEDYPQVYRNICMQTGDKIVVQAITPGITVQVFGEEVQYDNDAHYKMVRDRLDLLYAKLEEQRQTFITKEDARNTKLDNITTAIQNHETQYTCYCSCSSTTI